MTEPDKQNNKSGGKEAKPLLTPRLENDKSETSRFARPTSSIEKIPEATRKKILIFLVSFITLGIFIGWISTFSSAIDLSQDKESSKELNEILEQAAETINQVKEGVDQIKKIADTIPTTTPTTTEDLTEEEINLLKEKIKNIQDQ